MWEMHWNLCSLLVKIWEFHSSHVDHRKAWTKFNQSTFFALLNDGWWGCRLRCPKYVGGGPAVSQSNSFRMKSQNNLALLPWKNKWAWESPSILHIIQQLREREQWRTLLQLVLCVETRVAQFPYEKLHLFKVLTSPDDWYKCLRLTLSLEAKKLGRGFAVKFPIFSNFEHHTSYIRPGSLEGKGHVWGWSIRRFLHPSDFS